MAVTFLLPFLSAQNFSPASDETTHIPSGYTYIKTGDLKLNPQHPPLVKILSALPLTLFNINFDSQNPYFSSPLFNEWQFGKKFLASNDIDKILIFSRFSIQLLSVLCAFYLFLWASEMFGKRAGILAVFVYAFMPNIIAHSQFVTMDIAVSTFLFIAMYYLWKFFSAEDAMPAGRQGSASGGKIKSKCYLICSGVFLGLGLASKFSAVVFLPVFAGFLLIYVWRKGGDIDKKIRSCVIYGSTLIAVSFFVVYAFYFFPKDPGFYIRGMKSIYADWSGDHYFYLNSSFSTTGWWYYFVFVFLIKTPIPFLVSLFGALIFMFLKEYKLNNRDKAFLLVSPIFFFIITTLKAGDIGVRYILPIYPFLILFVSGWIDQLVKSSKLKFKNNFIQKFYTFNFIFLILAVWYVGSSVWIYPDYLAYFNEFVGGSSRGYRHLDDSNIEWGQDIKRLKAYQDKYPETKVIISWKYADLDYYGIKNKLEATKDSLSNPSGRIAVNVNLLIHLIQKSQEHKDPTLNWLSLYRPIDKIGQSFFIYQF